MKTLQGKLFLGACAVQILICIVIMISIPFFGSEYAPYLVGSIIWAGVAFYIIQNYDKGKNWAKIAMIVLSVLNALGLINYIRQVSGFLNIPGLGGMSAGFGLVMVLAIAGIAASVLVIMKTNKAGKISESGSSEETKSDDNADDKPEA